MLAFVTSFCAGLAVGCFILYLFELLSEVELQKNNVFYKPVPLLLRMLIPLVPLIRPAMARESFASLREKEHKKLQMAGYGETLSAADFLSLRVLFLILAALVLLLGSGGGQMTASLLVAALLAGYPELWLRGTIKKRHLSIMKALPNVLDLLTLSVESGKDLLSSLREILSRRRMDPLGEELTRAFREIQVGRKRNEALRDLAMRVRQEDLTATVNAIIQAEEYGVSIAQLLRIQGDMQRNKRFALAEKMANESSVKIIIPVVACILPAVFIVLLGPLIVQTMKMFH